MIFFKKCDGTGKCLKPCNCKCKSICTCIHKYHNGYCPNNCCNLIECRNYDYCLKKMPLWILMEYKGLCDTCHVQMGEHELLNKKDECPVCFEDSTLVKLSCGHLLCNECWYNITYSSINDLKKNFVPECPICRNKN